MTSRKSFKEKLQGKALKDSHNWEDQEFHKKLHSIKEEKRCFFGGWEDWGSLPGLKHLFFQHCSNGGRGCQTYVEKKEQTKPNQTFLLDVKILIKPLVSNSNCSVGGAGEADAIHRINLNSIFHREETYQI